MASQAFLLHPLLARWIYAPARIATGTMGYKHRAAAREGGRNAHLMRNLGKKLAQTGPSEAELERTKMNAQRRPSSRKPVSGRDRARAGSQGYQAVAKPVITL